jgi:hypothetical protein
MILSRVWYVVLGLAVAVALYVMYVAVGQYSRQGTRALKEGLASDSQTVEWAMKIDARRRLDALLVGSVDSTLQGALVAACGVKAGKIPQPPRDAARKALGSINDAIPADYRADALFAVDRDGQVIAELGYDQVAGNDEFELGGYPAVNDALHGWLRDDVWLLGSKMYVVVARPVEYDVTQRPAGAIVGLKEINERLVTDLAKRTRTALAFYVNGVKVAGGVGVDGFDAEKLDQVTADLAKIDDKAYGDGGRTDVHMMSDDLGAMFARLPGDVWTQGGGFLVARSKAPLAGPMGFLANADDNDKKNVPWLLLVAVVLLASVLGVGMTVLEHTLPLRELVMQAERLKAGVMDGLQVARFRGSYRLAAQNLNMGMERAIEKSGGVTRKPADLESIIGPVPAQPSMSAFSFPMSDGGSSPHIAPVVPPGPPPRAPSAPTFGRRPAPPPRPQPPAGMGAVPSPGAAFPAPSPAPSPRQPPAVQARPAPPPAPVPAPAPAPPPRAPAHTLQGAAPPFAAPPQPSGFTPVNVRPAPPPPAPPPPALQGGEEDEATMVGNAPAEVMAQATGENRVVQDDSPEWLSVYEDFIRTKKQCGEATDGLTYEKFLHTLKKNRDALIQRHGCKRVKFSVYVKEGRASLKATPVKD